MIVRQSLSFAGKQQKKLFPFHSLTQIDKTASYFCTIGNKAKHTGHSDNKDKQQ